MGGFRSEVERCGSARAALEALLSREGVRTAFPPAVEREVGALERAPGIDDGRLRDLTSLPFVTIDNEDSRDLDQALFIDEVAGGFEVLYALADASFYAPPESALFEEALLRGASFYLPGTVVPMLPRALSEGLVSLNEGVDRRALVFRVRLDDEGAVVETDLERARIRSRRKLSYEGVQRFLDAPSGHPHAREPFARSLALLAEVGRLRIERAAARDVVQLHRREVELRLEGGGVGFTLLAGARNDVERYNEQISLLVNTEGARFLLAHEGAPHVQPVFRTHPPPGDGAVERLARFVERLVEVQGLDERWRWRADESLARYLARLPAATDDERRLGLAIHRQALLLNQASRFDDTPAPHHGVGADVYARFSSPMREVAGIFTHKECLEILEGIAADPEADAALRERVIAQANAAKALQSRLTKEANKLALDHLFARELRLPASARRVFTGTLAGASRSKLYVLLDDPPIEVKVYLDEDAGFEGALVDEEGACVELLERKLGAGDRLALSVRGYDEGAGRWRFSLGA